MPNKQIDDDPGGKGRGYVPGWNGWPADEARQGSLDAALERGGPAVLTRFQVGKCAALLLDYLGGGEQEPARAVADMLAFACMQAAPGMSGSPSLWPGEALGWPTSPTPGLDEPCEDDDVYLTRLQVMKCSNLVSALLQGQEDYRRPVHAVVDFLVAAAAAGSRPSRTVTHAWEPVTSVPWMEFSHSSPTMGA